MSSVQSKAIPFEPPLAVHTLYPAMLSISPRLFRGLGKLGLGAKLAVANELPTGILYGWRTDNSDSGYGMEEEDEEGPNLLGGAGMTWWCGWVGYPQSGCQVIADCPGRCLTCIMYRVPPALDACQRCIGSSAIMFLLNTFIAHHPSVNRWRINPSYRDRLSKHEVLVEKRRYHFIIIADGVPSHPPLYPPIPIPGTWERIGLQDWERTLIQSYLDHERGYWL